MLCSVHVTGRLALFLGGYGEVWRRGEGRGTGRNVGNGSCVQDILYKRIIIFFFKKKSLPSARILWRYLYFYISKLPLCEDFLFSPFHWVHKRLFIFSRFQPLLSLVVVKMSHDLSILTDFCL